MKLQNKKILITGGSMGIGATIAAKCAAEGASIIITARHAEDLNKTIASLPGDGNSSHCAYTADIKSEPEVQRLAEKIGEKFSHIDGLVNCAGIYGPIGKTEEINTQQFEEAWRVNLLGTFLMCRAFLPLLKKIERGKIVNIAGGGASNPFPNYSAYASSKVGVVRLTENMALEYAPLGIDINVVAPGFVVTRFHEETIKAGDRAGQEFLKKTEEEIAKGGVPPEKAAELTIFLLSNESDGITGKFISAPWDPWGTNEFQKKLKKDKDFCTLRRIDDQNFTSCG